MSSATTILTTKPQNIAIETNPKHELNTVNVETPEPGPDDCLVHVRATGICGSDVHFWKEGAIGSSIIKHDLGLGHESAGEVVKIGSNVKGLKIGKSYLCPRLAGDDQRPGQFSRLRAVEVILASRVASSSYTQRLGQYLCYTPRLLLR